MEIAANLLIGFFWGIVLALGILTLAELNSRRQRKERSNPMAYERFKRKP